MAKGKGNMKSGAGGDGSHVPEESCKLGEIVTAAKSTMEAKSFERGYPVPAGFLHMKNNGKG